MAKVSVIKLINKKASDMVTIKINDQDVTVLQYLGIDAKSTLIQQVLNNAVDDNGGFSPVRLKVYFELEILKSYTNISITETMMKNPGKTYDTFVLNGIIKQVINAIPEDEYNCLKEYVYDCAGLIEKYNHSALGILRTITSDYNTTNMDIEGLLSQLKDPEQLTLVKNLLADKGISQE